MARAVITAISPPGASKATVTWTAGTADGAQVANDGEVLVLVRGIGAGATAMFMGVSDMHGRGGTIMVPASTVLYSAVGPLYQSGFNQGDLVLIDATPAAAGTVLEYVAVQL